MIIERRLLFMGAKAVRMIGFVLLVLFCTAAAYANGEIVIGVISPASGNYADHGAAERRGMEMAADEINAAGGILGGKTIKLMVEDSETDPAVAARKARRLIEVEGIKFLMGGVSSSVAASLSEVAKRYQVLFIATNQNSDEITGVEYGTRYMFRVCPDMAMALRALGPYVLKEVGDKWFFLTHDYTWGWSGTKWGREVLKEHGGTEVGELKVPLGTRDFSAFLLRARAAKPDALVITVGGIDRAALIEQIYEFGIYKEMTIVYTLYDYEDPWAAGPEKNVGFHGTEWYHYVDAPGVPEFVARYQQKYRGALMPVPTQNTVNGYLALRELAKAIDRAQSLNVPDVIRALEGHVIPEGESLGPGPAYIQEWDHQFVRPFYIVRSKKPEEMKDRTDLFEVVGWELGPNIIRSREENPVQLEKLPDE